ncbi:unnamed protein product [Rotaria socialis]|uniref:Large ribosomal subunit protein eL27 n=2 Tax=Rotaria socialis TaxID=392032 RepID=A0A819YJY7_9BILA|nr:unnamed protein product [Rotaria socialis]CAF4284141.1 unnamed protein product [Rotaria socialis]CAF4428092.1 unnamed protein product [Rotaria socialis]CAF4491843.1 unnamed protein product [Rotaria socialis]
MVKIMKTQKVVIVLAGRYAGRKAVVIKPYDEGSNERGYGHALIAGIGRYPRKVTKKMGKKKQARRNKIKTFVKVVNYNHLMATRYTVDINFEKSLINKEVFRDAGLRRKALRDVKDKFEERYLSIMNLSSRLNCIKQFQLKRLSHIIDHSLLYTTSAACQHQQQQPILQLNTSNIQPTSRLIKNLIENNRPFQKWFNSILRSFSMTQKEFLSKPFSKQDCKRIVLFNIVMSSIKSDPRNFPPEPGVGKNTLSDNESSSTNNDDPNKEQQPPTGPPPINPRIILTIFLVSMILTFFTSSRDKQNGANGLSQGYISWNEFVQDMLSKGEVEEVVIHIEEELAYVKLHPQPVVKGRKLFDRDTFVMKISNVDKFEEKLRKVEADLNIDPTSRILVSYTRNSQWPMVIFFLSTLVLIFAFLKSRVKMSFANPMDMMTKAKFTMVDPHIKVTIPKITFRDVAGMREAKQEVMEFVEYMKSPQKFVDLGAKVPKGALLLGPPGIGKTLLAKAVAAEAGVPFLYMAGSEFVEVIGGLGAARVRDLFREAHKRSPCIIYIDEIDAIGKKRRGENKSSYMTSSEEEHTLNQLLVEMDGLESKTNVIMLASTNRPDVLDKALLRPGRFDRHILIDYPTLPERVEILDVYLKKLKLEKDIKFYSGRLAQLTPGMSGADLANICNEAALYAAREGKKVIDRTDFEIAVERVLAGAAKRDNTMAPAEKRTVAFHESGHVIAGWFLKTTCLPLKVTIVPRTGPALGFAQYMPKDRKLLHEDDFDEDLCVMLGGRVAEQVVFNTVSTGAQDDLRRATKLAYAQIKQYGMSKTIGLISFPADQQNPQNDDFGVKPYSKRLQRMMDEEAQQRLANAFKRTEKLMTENRAKLNILAEQLLARETLNYDDIVQLIGPSPYPNKQKLDIIEWNDSVSTLKSSTTPPSSEPSSGTGKDTAGESPSSSQQNSHFTS